MAAPGRIHSAKSNIAIKNIYCNIVININWAVNYCTTTAADTKRTKRCITADIAIYGNRAASVDDQSISAKSCIIDATERNCGISSITYGYMGTNVNWTCKCRTAAAGSNIAA